MAKAKKTTPTKAAVKSAVRPAAPKKEVVEAQVKQKVLPIAVRYFDKLSGHTVERMVRSQSDWKGVVDADRVDWGLGVFIREAGMKWKRVE
jgi:hypothetical protein